MQSYSCRFAVYRTTYRVIATHTINVRKVFLIKIARTTSHASDFLRLVFALWLLLICFLTRSGYSAELTIHLRADGDNQADGLTDATAVASLQVAIDLALAKAGPSDDSFRIRVSPGDYIAQRAMIPGVPDSRPLVITSDEGDRARPRFDGGGEGGTWLMLKSASGKPTRLTVAGLEIANYVTAISLNGSRTSESTSNSHNVIRNNVFRNIGQIAFPSGKPSTAAVRLVNSDNNEIRGNRFINIRNITGCPALHSIYIAHYSTDNRISQNVFDGGCGAAIKVRDASNNNRIDNNDFLNQEQPVLLDSFCDKNTRDDCTKEKVECPSWNNKFYGNRMAMLGKRASLSPVKAVGDNRPSGCPNPEQDSLRIQQMGNLLK